MDTKQSSSDELFKTLVVELVNSALREKVEPLVEARVQAAVEETELRAYNDEELCARLGGIGRTTLWKIRKRGLLKSSALHPGGPRRTTPTQLREYLASIETDDGEVVNLDNHRHSRRSRLREDATTEVHRKRA